MYIFAICKKDTCFCQINEYVKEYEKKFQETRTQKKAASAKPESGIAEAGGARRFSCGHADARTRDLFRQAVLGAPQYHYTAAPVAKGIVCSRVPVSILAS